MLKYLWNHKLSLRAKFNITLIVVLILTMMVGMALIVAVTYKAQEKAMQSKAKSIAFFVSKLSVDPILYNDVLKIDSIATEVCKDEDVLYVFLYNEKGDLLNSLISGLDLEDSELKSIIGGQTSNISDEFIKKLTTNRKFINISLPVEIDQQTIVGTVKIGVTKKNIIDLVIKTSLAMGIILLFIVLATTVTLYYLFNFLVFKPLHLISDTTKNLASGDLTAKIEIKSNDEIWNLAKAINQLAVNLKELIMGTKELVIKASKTTKEVISYSGDLFKGAEIQQNSLKNTGKSIEAIDKTISQVAIGSDSLALSAEESSHAIIELASSIKEIANSTQMFNRQAEDAAASVEELVASINEISVSLNHVSMSIDETAGTATEISVAVKEVEAAAADSARLAEIVRKEAEEKGLKAGEIAIKGIVEIKETVNSLSEVIKRLDNKSLEIGKILNVIEDVAEQTRLLALNAAILAAQSGNEGNGFSVVADQIKDLAERTGKSTKEIAELITAVQEEARASVKMVAIGIEKVEEGVKLVKSVNEVLHNIKDSSTLSTEKAKSIQRSTVEQSLAIKQISDAIIKIKDQMELISRATKEQTKGSKIIIESVEKIKYLSEQLKNTTEEQSIGSNQIAEVVEKVSQQAVLLKETTNLQKEESKQILDAVNQIKKVSDDTVKFSNHLAEVIKGLESETNELLKEIEKFRV